MFWYELTRPFCYLSIKHPAKYIIDWVIPSLFSFFTVILLTVYVYYKNNIVEFFSDEGVIPFLLSFIQTLPGFYIAALSAIAAFGGSNLDRRFPGICPTIKIKKLGKYSEISLTRRRYLAMLFAYLTALSIVLTLLSIISIKTSNFFISLIPNYIVNYSNLPLIFFYLLFIFQLIIITFHSLYYLGDKIYDPSE